METTQPQPETFLLQQENISLHYPFVKNKVEIKGDVGRALERIKLVRSGKPHVTGTLPLDVSPDEPLGPSEALLPTTPGAPKTLLDSMSAAKITQKTVQIPAEQLELIRKQKKRERRLARKAKRRAEEAKNGSS